MSVPPADLTRCDLLIRAGTVVDGSGRPAFRADVALSGDRVAAIGDLAHVQAEEIVEAAGHVIAPGFIDIHTHDDRALLDDRSHGAEGQPGRHDRRDGQLRHQPCAGGPVRRAARHLSNCSAMRPGFRFAAFGDYLGALERRPAGGQCRVASSATRRSALATIDRPRPRRAPTRRSRACRRCSPNALDAGAIGLSSSGLYYPASRGRTDRRGGRARARDAIARRPLRHAHARRGRRRLEASIDETLRIGREAGVAVLISHHKVIGPRNFGRSVRTLRQIEAAMRTQRVALDLYPYVAGSTVLVPRPLRRRHARHASRGRSRIRSSPAEWSPTLPPSGVAAAARRPSVCSPPARSISCSTKKMSGES